MFCRPFSAVMLLLALTLGTTVASASPDTSNCSPGSSSEDTKCGDGADSSGLYSPAPAATVPAVGTFSGNLLAATAPPRVVFQINQAADASTILRYVTNYLIAEPAAEVVVVGYAGGVDFMLKGAKDAAGKPFAGQLQALAEKGVRFKVCGNTLAARKLGADAVAPQAAVVPGAVNEIIRLQTREGYAYFRH